MSHYIVDSTRKVSDSQRLVLAIPLAITMVFCFAFVAMVHPSKSRSGVTAAQDSGKSKSSADSLPPIPINSAPASTLSTTDSGTSAANTAGDNNSENSRPNTKASPTTPKTTTPQSASQNHGDKRLYIKVGNKTIGL